MKFKKTAAVVLAAVIATSSFTAFTAFAADDVSAVADEELQAGDSFVEGDLSYYVLGDGTLAVSCPIDKKDTLTYLVIPSEVRGIKVTGIGESAFLGCESLTAVTIPDSIIDIGNSAFQACTSLTEVTIPNSVIRINKSVFWFCTNLESITLGDSITSIDEGAFFQCESLKAITIPDSVTSIDKIAFQYCTSLESITIPNSVTSIGVQAFFNCTSLTDVYYIGTEEQWKEIEISAGNDDLTNANITFADSETSEPETSAPTPSQPSTSQPSTSQPSTNKPAESDTSTTEPTEFTPVIDDNEAIDEATKTVLKGITVTDSDGAFEEDVEMKVSFIESSDGLFSFNITFTKDGAEVQPNGKVTVKVPVPEALKNGSIYVYHYDGNGNITLIPSKVENGYVIFETDHFSVYALSNELIEDDNSETSTPASSETTGTNPGTGIGYAFVPAFIAAGAVIASIKKRK